VTERSKLRARIEELGPWYHYIEFGNGVITPGDRDQSLVFAMYRDHLPVDLTEKTVLDLGANAAGLSIEFARRGALVTAVEASGHYCDQAHFVVEEFGLSDRVEILQRDIYSLADWSRRFDIVCYVGLSYHLPYPQLALDMLSHLCDEQLISSTQTVPGDALSLHNRARHLVDRDQDVLHGWEPTERLFLSMLAHAGFRNPEVISTAPHPDERVGRLCGNRSYFLADAPVRPTPLPFMNDPSYTGRAQDRRKRRARSPRSE
jgi:SAM-dependent methyltransferase